MISCFNAYNLLQLLFPYIPSELEVISHFGTDSPPMGNDLLKVISWSRRRVRIKCMTLILGCFDTFAKTVWLVKVFDPKHLQSLVHSIY